MSNEWHLLYAEWRDFRNDTIIKSPRTKWNRRNLQHKRKIPIDRRSYSECKHRITYSIKFLQFFFFLLFYCRGYQSRYCRVALVRALSYNCASEGNRSVWQNSSESWKWHATDSFVHRSKEYLCASKPNYGHKRTARCRSSYAIYCMIFFIST